MTSIIIQASVPEGYSWLSYDGFAGERVFRHICQQLAKGMIEPHPEFGWENSMIDDFIIIKMAQQRAERLLLGWGEALDTFSYGHLPFRGYSREPVVAVAVTYEEQQRHYGTFSRWRARNAFGKIIDNAGHPNGFELEMRTYQDSDGKMIKPTSLDERFYVHGSDGFQKEYLRGVNRELRRGRVLL